MKEYIIFAVITIAIYLLLEPPIPDVSNRVQKWETWIGDFTITNPTEAYSTIHLIDTSGIISDLRSTSYPAWSIGSKEFQFSATYIPEQAMTGGPIIYSGVGDAGIWTSGKYYNHPYCFNAIFYYDGGSYTGYGEEACSTKGSPYTILLYDTDYFVVDIGPQFSSLYMDIAIPGDGITLEAEYFNSTDWVYLGIESDMTNNLMQSGIISIKRPTDMSNIVVSQLIPRPHQPPLVIYTTLLRPIRFRSSTIPVSGAKAYLTVPSGDNRLEIRSNGEDTVPMFSTDVNGNVNLGLYDPFLGYGVNGGDFSIYSDWNGNKALYINSTDNYDVQIGNIQIGYGTNLGVTGNMTIGEEGFPGCFDMRDSDDSGWTRCETLSGVLSCTVGRCSQ